MTEVHSPKYAEVISSQNKFSTILPVSDILWFVLSYTLPEALSKKDTVTVLSETIFFRIRSAH